MQLSGYRSGFGLATWAGARKMQHPMELYQTTPPLERRSVVVPDRAQSCRQAANEVLFLLGFPQTHDVADGVKHLLLVAVTRGGY